MRDFQDEDLKIIFRLKSQLENAFFKGFLNEHTLPETLNFTHVKTMIILLLQGSLPMSDISRLINLEKGSFTSVANELIKQGYLEKEQSQADKRVYNLKLTQKGQDYAKDFTETHLEFIKEKLCRLSIEEQAAYFNALKVLIDLTEKI